MTEMDVEKLRALHEAATANIVDRARVIVVDAIRSCEQPNGYLLEISRKIENAEGVAVDSWLVLDAVILALKTDDPQHNRAGGLWYRRWHEARAAILPLAQERDRLREALDWYAEQTASCRKVTSEGEAARFALDKDGGKRARAALTAANTEKGGVE